ncbi:sulfotransferase domain-containing protein [Nonomuraea sp. NPDC049400]|uniref:sulfotransferase domain-containing protein n=1 Tax=Nonomuraea sp. NPDC049400 TaxID=3364352 RepID=UPI00379A0750
MIIWISSFPRSGNTYFRILLNRLYGIRTSSVYRVDGTAHDLGADLVGARPRPRTIREMRESAEPYFLKTHRLLDADHLDDRIIYLCRDGRDALVSAARLSSLAQLQRASEVKSVDVSPEAAEISFEHRLRHLLVYSSHRASGSWAEHVLRWNVSTSCSSVALVRYEDLVSDPVGIAEQAVAAVLPGASRIDGQVPTFGELQTADPGFFRRGVAGSHHDELPDRLQDLFWSCPLNVEAMNLLGYQR